MTLTVVFALDAESAPWRARHAFRAAPGRGRRLYEGAVGATRTRVVSIGVGAPGIGELADLAVTPETRVVLVAGLAGALRPGSTVGDIVVPRWMRSHASQAFAAADPPLVALAARCGAREVETLLSSPRVVSRVEDKARLAREAEVVDMESFAVATEAARRGARALAIRAIGDLADEALPIDFMRAVRSDGTISPIGVLKEIARRPRLPSLLAFGLRQRRAIRRLADFLDAFVPRLDEAGLR